MEALSLHTGAPKLNREYNKSFIFALEAKIFTPIVEHIDIPVYFLQEIFDNIIFIPKMKSIVSCCQICAPSHAQVQLSEGVINE